jgi:hypothetical protein
MAASGAPAEYSRFGAGLFAIILIVFHILDLLVFRRGGLVSFDMILWTFIAYLVFALWAKFFIFKEEGPESLYWFLAIWFVPIGLGLLSKWLGPVPWLGTITIIAAYFPLFIFYFYSKGIFARLITLYLIAWTIGLLIWQSDNLKNYAGAQGIQPGYNSMLSYEYLFTKSVETLGKLWEKTVKISGQVLAESKRAIATASGDYYTGTVDAAATKRLGVYLENFRTAESFFYENTPVDAYITMKAETLDKPLDIGVSCVANDKIPASRILPASTFNIITSDKYDIDCIWNKEMLKNGIHTLKFNAEFEFTTRAYLKSYVMDRDRLREYRRQNKDPLEGTPDKNPIAVYTSGPVRIGMGLGQQPLAIGRQGEALPALGVTIENSWEGRIIELRDIFFLLPKGIKASKEGAVTVTTSSCAALPAEEQPACDGALVNVYQLAIQPDEAATYKNLTTKNIRIPLEIESPENVLGKAPIAVQNFKVSAHYRYQLERITTVNVREAPKAEVSP